MTTVLINIIGTIFYGNVFIAWTAMCMVWITVRSIDGATFTLHPYDYFIFCSTITLYNLHRYIGLQRVLATSSRLQDRFVFMRDHHRWLFIAICITGGLSAGIGLRLASSLTITAIGLLVIPIIISGLYAIPIFKTRLRDIAYLKIILIAINWSWLTAYFPAYLLGLTGTDIILISLERFLFILAITIPFDIRDQHHDRAVKLKTVVSAIGVNRSKWLAWACLILAALISYLLHDQGVYYHAIMGAYLITYALSAFIIRRAYVDRHELYYVGLIDGLMALPFLLSLCI